MRFFLGLALLLCAPSSIALGEEPPRPAPKPQRPPPKQLFDGRSLQGWRVLSKIDFEKHGQVAVRDGVIHLGRGQPATGIALRAKPPRVNYELRLEAKRVQGDDFFCGLTFPYRDAYCTLILGGWGGRVTGLSNVDGEPAVENLTAGFVEFQQDQWYRVRLRVTTQRIAAWVDDEQIVDLPTADRKFTIWWEQEPARPLGIATWNTAAALRKLSIQKIEPGPPAK